MIIKCAPRRTRYVSKALHHEATLADDADDEEAELRNRIAGRAARLFHGFRRVLQAHKKAESLLGIPVPQAPSEPGS